MAKKRKKANEEGSISLASPMEDKSWRARHDMQTIQDAHEIIGDSERMKHVKEHARKQKESLSRIERLKDKSI
jgi:hypothetical protein